MTPEQIRSYASVVKEIYSDDNILKSISWALHEQAALCSEINEKWDIFLKIQQKEEQDNPLYEFTCTDIINGDNLASEFKRVMEEGWDISKFNQVFPDSDKYRLILFKKKEPKC